MPAATEKIAPVTGENSTRTRSSKGGTTAAVDFTEGAKATAGVTAKTTATATSPLLPPTTTTTSEITNTSNKGKKKRKKSKRNKSNNVNISQQQQLQSNSGSISNKKRNRNGGGSASAPTPLHLPHVKITLRNINGAERHGSGLKLVSMIRKMVDCFNGTTRTIGTSNGVDGGILLVNGAECVVPIFLDEASVERTLMGISESILAVGASEANDSLGKGEEKGEERGGEEGLHIAAMATVDEKSQETISFATTVSDGDTKSELKTDFKDIAEKSTSTGNKGDTKDEVKEMIVKNNKTKQNVITARMLYMVPPRKSHRRGEIPGRVYLVLHPPIPTFAISREASATSLFSSCAAASGTGEKKMNIEVNAHTNNYSGHNPSNTGILSSAQRSKAIAQSRLLLRQTITRLTELCRSDASKSQTFGQTLVETSLSQKTWKADYSSPLPTINTSGNTLTTGGTNAYSKKAHHHGYGHYFAKYDSTIEQSDDFKSFLEQREKAEEMRLSRPKPSPGGGGITSLMNPTNIGNVTEDVGCSGVNTNSDKKGGGKEESALVGVVVGGGANEQQQQQAQSATDNGQPIAAIIVHLREQQQLMKQSKKSSKKPSSSSALVLPSTGVTTSSSSTGVSNGQQKKSKQLSSSGGKSKPSGGGRKTSTLSEKKGGGNGGDSGSNNLKISEKGDRKKSQSSCGGGATKSDCRKGGAINSISGTGGPNNTINNKNQGGSDSNSNKSSKKSGFGGGGGKKSKQLKQQQTKHKKDDNANSNLTGVGVATLALGHPKILKKPALCSGSNDKK